MKFNKFLATAAVCVFAMSAAVSAADPIVLDFSNADYVATWPTSGNNVTAEFDAEEGCIRLDVSNNDPYLTMTLAEDQKIPADTYKWAVMEYKTVGGDGVESEFFWGNDNYSGPAAQTNQKWYRDVDNDEWCKQVITFDCADWNTTVHTLRIDAFQDEGSWGDESMWIKYIAFCDSEEAANAYTYAAAAAEPEAPAEDTTTPAPDTSAPAETPADGAAQTADMASVAVAGLVAAAAAAVVISKKR